MYYFQLYSLECVNQATGRGTNLGQDSLYKTHCTRNHTRKTFEQTEMRMCEREVLAQQKNVIS